MKFKRIIAIATAAAFAVTGPCYAETAGNLATEGSDVTDVVEDISLTGDRIETDDETYYTNDLTVNFSLSDETGIRSAAIVVNGQTLAEKTYDAADSIEAEDGEVMNADSTIETEEEGAVPNTSQPLTTVSDSLTISADDIKELNDTAKAAEPQPEEPADTQPAAETVEPDADANAAAAEEPAQDSAQASDEETPAADAQEGAEQPAEAAVGAETDTSGPETVDAAQPETGAAEADAGMNDADPPEAVTEESAADADVEAAEKEADATDPEQPAAESEQADADAPATYTAQLVITDVNGETETKDFDFSAAPAETNAEQQEAAGELRAMGLSNVQVVDATTYRIEVNLTCQAVTFFKKNASGIYKPIRVAVCSTARKGCNTPVGTWKIGPYKKKCARSRWALMSSKKSYAQYLVRFKGGKCFHSIIYKKRGDNSQMYNKEYNKLGSVASAGCVRLRAVDAKWIYDNCPNGTVVKVYKSSTASPLGVPTYKKVSTAKTLGWDPTDPDTGNPYKGGAGIPTGIYINGTTITYENATPNKTVQPNIAKHSIKLAATRYVYNGKVRTPAVTVYGLKKNTNFTVTYPAGRKNVGRYDITVKGKGEFTGTKTITFRIYPKGTSITKLKKSGKKKFSVQYKKVTKQITGYQIKYSTSSKFDKNCKTINVKGYKNTKRVIKTPKKGTYYVKVRVYKINKEGYKYYSNWSGVKKVKTK